MAGPQDSYPGVPQASWGRDPSGNPVVVVTQGGEGGYVGGGARRGGGTTILWMGVLLGGMFIATVLLGLAYLDLRGKQGDMATMKSDLLIAQRTLKTEQERVTAWRDAYFNAETEFRKVDSENASLRIRRGLSPIVRTPPSPPNPDAFAPPRGRRK